MAYLSDYTTRGAIGRAVLDVGLVLALFVVLLVNLGNPWRDLLIASNRLIGADDDPAYRSVFVQIDQAFLSEDRPLTIQLEQWGQLLSRLQQANPAAILVDYQFSPHRFEKLLPGHADQFERILLQLSEQGILVLGLAPSAGGIHARGFTLELIEEHPSLKRACMVFDLDHDEVMRDFQDYPDSAHCPEIGRRSIAGLTAELLGANVQARGLILSRGLESVRSVSAASLLSGPLPESLLKGAVVVVGSNFPFEDEFKSAHLTGVLGTHPQIKGGLIHALNTEALLENRVAWQVNGYWISVTALLILGLFFIARRKPALTRFLWWGAAILLALDLLLVNLFLRYADIIVVALLCLSSALLLTGKSMLTEIYMKRQIQGLLGGLLSPAVFNQYLSNPVEFFRTRRYDKACVLVLDLKGYSRDAQHDDLDTLFTRTNELLAACTRVIHQHGGCVERFRGDGLLAYFGAPLPSDQPLEQAIDTAMTILDMLKNPATPVLNQFHHRVRFGISAGEVILGKVGDDQRFDIAVTGLAANRAAHFESLADPFQWPIVVDEPSWQTSALYPQAVRLPFVHPKHPELALRGLSGGQV